jgi:sugar phosphate isomerase/epimerase
MKPIALQLYSVRDYCEKDFTGTIKKVADMGYKGVEPAGFFDLSPAEFKKVVNDCGMEVSSSHGPWIRKMETVSEAIDVAGTLGIDLVCSGFGKEEYKDMDAIKKTADFINEAIAKLKGTGLSLFMHNHYWEFEKINGKLKYEYFEEMVPDALFEIDAYWTSNFEANDVAEMVGKFKDKMPLIHLKDGILKPDTDMLPLGTGKMDVKGALKAANPDLLRWIIVELDRVAGDSLEAVNESYQYMITQGLAEGNK